MAYLRFTGVRSALCGVLALLAAVNAVAADWTVDVGGAELAYAPATLHIVSGDTVTFVNRGGFHNVTADDASFRCAQGCDGAGGSGDPSSTAWSASVTFPTPGTIGYHCEVHGLAGVGMFGSVVVGAPAPLPPPPNTLDTVSVGGPLLALMLASTLVIAVAMRRRRYKRLR